MSLTVTCKTSVICRGRKEGNVLFNDTLNTFYLRLYGVRHMVKDHSDSEKGNPLPPLFHFFYMHHPTDKIAHTTAFVTPVVEHWLEREIAQWVHPMKDRSDNPSHHERTLLPRSYISLLIRRVTSYSSKVAVLITFHITVTWKRCQNITMFYTLFCYVNMATVTISHSQYSQR